MSGYSRLMGADEEGTLARPKAIRKTLVDPTIASRRGRIVKTTGDGMLVEFASAVDAVRSALEVQRNMADQNAAVPTEQRIEFRVGIHVGDINFDDNDIFGDRVNIAARLEGIAELGGVCISDYAQRQIRDKVETHQYKRRPLVRFPPGRTRCVSSACLPAHGPFPSSGVASKHQSDPTWVYGRETL